MALRLQQTQDDLDDMHEINVTPFIDVMLVLLIVFMIAAPLATVDIPVELPAADAARTAEPDKPLLLTLKPDLSLTLGDAPVTRDTLGAALTAARGGRAERRIYLHAAKTVPYGALMDVMNSLRAAGFLDVALVGLESGKAPKLP
jgi:biopolymer transport protein ExbD